MTTEQAQRQRDLAWNLFCAWRTLDQYHGDDNGKLDILHRIRRVEERYREAGGSQAEFLEFCARQDLEISRQREVAMERAYARTGIVPTEAP
jgi:hypothetical protein